MIFNDIMIIKILILIKKMKIFENESLQIIPKINRKKMKFSCKNYSSFDHF